jgi:hypothetical protein
LIVLKKFLQRYACPELAEGPRGAIRHAQVLHVCNGGITCCFREATLETFLGKARPPHHHIDWSGNSEMIAQPFLGI